MLGFGRQRFYEVIENLLTLRFIGSENLVTTIGVITPLGDTLADDLHFALAAECEALKVGVAGIECRDNIPRLTVVGHLEYAL